MAGQRSIFGGARRPNVETSGLAPESLESGRRQTAQRAVELTWRGADVGER